MSSQNEFDRVKLTALQAWDGLAFNISAKDPVLGYPIDWIVFTGSFISSINSGTRKAGANKIVLTQLGVDNGFKDVGGATISWTGDGNSPASGNTGGLMHVQQSQTMGNGVRAEVTVGAGSYSGRWPDALQLRSWDICYGVRQTLYTASLLGDPDAVTQSEPEVPTTWLYQLTDFVFASEVPGAVARLDSTRSGLSMGNWIFSAYALYNAPKTVQTRRGANNARIWTAQ